MIRRGGDAAAGPDDSGGTGMWETVRKKKILITAAAELAVLLICAIHAFVSYSGREYVFGQEDMQIQNRDGSIVSGEDCLTFSDTEAKAVVTPAFSGKGIYYLEASYQGQGIVKAGLIYDAPRNGAELVDNEEFYPDCAEGSVSYRFRLRDSSPVRFKARLTGDAADGDYVRLLRVRVVPSRLTCVYPIVVCAGLLALFTALLIFYNRCYVKMPRHRQAACLALVMAALFAGLPLYRNGLPDAVDLSFHLHRIEGICLGLRAGQFPVRIQPGWLDGNGYAVSVMYGDILLYFPALLRMVGFSVQDAYKLYIAAVNFGTAVIAFYSFRRMAKDDLAALTGTLLYVCGAMRLQTIYIGMLGEYSGMMFYPLIIMAFYLLFTEEVGSRAYRRLWLPLTAGFSGLVLTHLVGSLMMGVFSLLACLLMIRRVLRKETLRELIKAVAASVALCAWYLAPFVQYMCTEPMVVNKPMRESALSGDLYALLADYTQDGRNLYELFTMHSSVGYTVLLLLAAYLVTLPLQQKNALTLRCRLFFLFTAFALWVCTDYFPTVWLAGRGRLILRYFYLIQHQERFLCVALALAAAFGAVFVGARCLDRKVLYPLLGLLCLANLSQNLQYFAEVENDAVYVNDADLSTHYGKDNYEYGLVNAEYLPVATSTYNITKETVSSETLTVTANDRRYLTYDTTVINNADTEGHIVYPILYYSGYRAVDRTDGTVLETAAGDNGQVDVTVPAGYAGTFRMAFHEPWYWRAAELVSLAALVGFLYLGIGRRKAEEYNGAEESI